MKNSVLFMLSLCFVAVTCPATSVAEVKSKPSVNKNLKVKLPTRRAPPGTIPLQYPDLQVVNLHLASGEVRFQVKNRGNSTKKPGKLNYQLTVQLLTASNTVSTTTVHTGIAPITSLSRLKPGQTSAIDRAAGKRIPKHPWIRITLCVNRDRKLLETNYRNNCMTKNSRQLLTDLQLVDGRLILFKPKKKKNWLSRVGSFIWDVIDGGIDFDVSGLKEDYVVVFIRNRGTETVSNFQVSVGLNHPGGLSKTYTAFYRQKIAPGKVLRAYVHVDKDKKRYNSPNCCYVVGAVDPYNKISESNESNNKKVLRVLKRDNIRDHR